MYAIQSILCFLNKYFYYRAEYDKKVTLRSVRMMTKKTEAIPARLRIMITSTCVHGHLLSTMIIRTIIRTNKK